MTLVLNRHPGSGAMHPARSLPEFRRRSLLPLYPPLFMRAAALFLLVLLPPLASAQIAIDSARTLPLGTVVTVSGYVTVGNEFGGPIYFQDGTAGLAAFYTPLHGAVQRGDSLVITGPLSEFQASTGQPGTGLFQISGQNVQYTAFPEVDKPQTPRVVTVADIGEALEGQLVLVRDATINFTGSFQANTNYALSDATGQTQLRIDNTTNLVGAAAPQGPTNVIGVVSQFRGTYQILPRDVDDLGVDGFTIPGEDLSRDLTFEVGTWNLRWFGDPNQYPDDDALQFQNVLRVLRTMDLDVIGLQEVSNPAVFAQLVDSLDGYKGILAPISQTQKTAILYKTATVDSVGAGFYLASGDWASGRYPYAFSFDATLGGRTERFLLLNLHAKATISGTASNDYVRRLADAQQLKDELDRRHPNTAVIVVGDFNDDVDVSTVQNRPSPYAAFVADADDYRFLTASLSARGFSSISGGQMIDHILVTDEVLPFYFAGTERVENPSYIGSYLSTTSDHYPVWVRFDIAEVTPVAASEAPDALALQVLPNPSAGAATLVVRGEAGGVAAVKVFDVLGRRVLSEEIVLAASFTRLPLDVPDAAGLYFVQVTTPTSRAVTRWVVAR